MSRDLDASISGIHPVKQAVISENTIANNEIVAAVAGKSIRLISLMMTVDGAVDIQWKSATAARSGLMEFADSGGMTAESQTGLLWTAIGAALNLDQSTTAQVSGTITYIEVDGA